VSLGIAVVTTIFAIDAFRAAPIAKPTGAETLDGMLGNGSVYLRYEDNQGLSRLGVVELDGSGLRDAFQGGPAVQYEQISFSPDGMRLAYINTWEADQGIYVANADGSQAMKITDHVNDSWPNWSPDGTKIAFVGTRFDASLGFCHPGVYADCLTDIYAMNADGSEITDVTGDPGWEFDPVWSPDGTRIAFASTPDVAGLTAITVMNADGSDRMTLSSSNGGSDFDPDWSPDGTQIIFGGIHYENWGLFEVRPDGTDERTLLFDVGTYAVEPVWSPDGSLIAFGGNVDNYGEPEAVYTMKPDGSGITKLADLPDRWSIREIAWGPTPTLVSTASVTETFDVGLQGQASGLTYGFGSIWVDGFEDPTGLGQVIRLDPETGDEQADISIGSVAPGWEVGGGGIAVGEGSVWVVGTEQVPGASPGVFDGLDTVLVRIDPSTNHVVDRVVLGGKVAADIAIDVNGVWVLFGGDDDEMLVARIDPATDQVVATIPLDYAFGHYVFAIDGSILAFTNETTDVIGNSVLNFIDPITNTITRSIPQDEYVWPAVGDGSVWISSGPSIMRLDPSSGEVVETWQVRSTGDALAVGAGGVWFLGADGRTISRWNPTVHAVDVSVDPPSATTPNVLLASADSVWVLNFEGSVTLVRVT